MKSSNSKVYETSDTPLATWLIINQIKLIDINSAHSPAIFLLDSADNPKINDLIFQWDSGNAIANCVSFYKTYRNLVHRIKGD